MVKRERRGRVAVLTLARPEAGNAFDLAMARGLAEAVAQAAADSAIGAVLLTAEGPRFSVGGDLRSFVGAAEGPAAYVRAIANAAHQAVMTIARAPKPFVCAVQGPAAGLGFSLAMSCDVVIAGRRAAFTAAYSAIGLSPDGGLSFILPRLAGRRLAQDMLYRNRRLDAEDALAAGLVTELVEDDGLAEAALRVATELAAGSATAFAQVKSLIGLEAGLAAHLDREAAAIERLMESADGREGVAAYLAKRQPVFAGGQEPAP